MITSEEGLDLLPVRLLQIVPVKDVNEVATMSHAVMSSSRSRCSGGISKGSMHSGMPFERKGVQIRTSIVSMKRIASSQIPALIDEARTIDSHRQASKIPLRVQDERGDASKADFLDEGLGHDGLARSSRAEHGRMAGRAPPVATSPVLHRCDRYRATSGGRFLPHRPLHRHLHPRSRARKVARGFHGAAISSPIRCIRAKEWFDQLWRWVNSIPAHAGTSMT